MAGTSVVLRPHNQTYPVEVVPIAESEDISDYLIGRICYVGMET
jgi:hypothetical protein